MAGARGARGRSPVASGGLGLVCAAMNALRDSSPLLEGLGLVKHLGGRRILHGIDIQCRAGQVIGLLGANGAGKSTTVRCCSGMLRLDAGCVRIAGHELQLHPDAALRQLGVCTQDDTFDADFTVRDNLLMQGRYFRPRIQDMQARVAELLELFDLGPYADKRPETLSGGYRRRLGIARALVHRPRLLFLDEPTTGLDPEARMALWDLVDRLRAEGLGIILTTHYMDEAQRLSDALIILREGQIAAQGSSQQVLGRLVGEHVVVIRSNQSRLVEEVEQWLRISKRNPANRVLGALHFPLDAAGLAAFSLAFPQADFEVRSPNLDDLFLTLAKGATP
ncbi:MAG: ABC transporter ATP-binding protein [Planctomycetota bacterium]|nr:MAG: ABC transporter ATP-binding protein [Planctomycetota bacterium]